MPLGEFAYANNSNRFMACAPLGPSHRLAIVGVPFDGAVTNRPGARFGPQEIRRASLMLCDAIHPEWGVSPAPLLGDAGDMRLSNASGLPQVRAEIEQQAADLMQAHYCVFLGGDHSVTLPLLRAAHAKWGPLALVHFDAHCDTWTEHFSEPSGHGTWTHEAIDQGLVDVRKVVQIGIRSPGERAAVRYVADRGGLILTGQQLRGRDGQALEPMVSDILRRIGNAFCYVTLDIDCLDPAHAPGTGTPEPGGMTTGQLLTFLEGLAPLNTVALDCCEVAPAYDHAELTSMAASHAVWTYLCAQARKF